MKNLVSSQMRRPNTNTLKIMNKKEVKQLTKGCTVLVKATVESVQETKAYVHHGCITHPLPFSEIYSVPTQPKHDPCRKFRKGDKVRVVEWNGRNPVLPFMDCKVGDIGTVIKEEDATSFFVRLHLEGKYEKDMPYCHLELVTPVEELEPYSIDPETTTDIFKNGDWYAHFGDADDAEAVCAMLNAEYRKECNNA